MVTEGSSEEQKTNKLSHRKWKSLLKKEKRRIRRQKEAKEREDKNPKDENKDGADDADKSEDEEEKKRQQQLHEMWLQREQAAQREWQQKQERIEREKQRRLEQERKIREEWEEQEKKEKEEMEEKNKVDQLKKEKQDELLKQATANEKTDSWHNPIVSTIVGRERENCSFFLKTATCRFGDRCSRSHPHPDRSTTLLFPGMFVNFRLEQTLEEDHETDIALEYDDTELYEKFHDFYYDVLSEFKKVGHVVQFKVCCNCEVHLRGNVYVQYRNETEAEQALIKFNGRWYGGRQISGHFVNIAKWKSAICAQFFRRKCPKGNRCNFLHVFQNPGNEFWEADRDLMQNNNTGRQFSHNHDNSRLSRDQDNYRNRRSHSGSRSKSPSTFHRRRRRSRSRDRRSTSNYSKRSYSRRSRSRSPRYKKSRERSQSRSPHREGSPLRGSSKVNSHKKSNKRSQSKMNSVRSEEMSSNCNSQEREGKHKKKKHKHNKHKHKEKQSKEETNVSDTEQKSEIK